MLDLINSVEVDPAQRTPELIRGGLDALWAMWNGDLPDVGVANRTIPGPAGDIPVRVYTPGDVDGATPIIVFLHGGGFVVGTLDSHDATARRLCEASGTVVMSVDYRLAPEHPFPAGPDDCWAALSWAAEHGAEIGGDPARLAVAGDSAGANLAAVTALRARDEGLTALKAQALVYPCFDWKCESASQHENANGYLLTRDTMQWFYELYAPDVASPYSDPRVADDLSGSVPALVITAEFDPLRDEGEDYAAMLGKAGVAVEHTRYDGMIHGFFSMFAVTPRAQEAVDEVAAFLRSALF
jgi:acetyl esterase/lipase